VHHLSGGGEQMLHSTPTAQMLAVHDDRGWSTVLPPAGFAEPRVFFCILVTWGSRLKIFCLKGGEKETSSLGPFI
jgi:hypothetical protein